MFRHKIRFRNDVDRVGWDFKLYILTHSSLNVDSRLQENVAYVKTEENYKLYRKKLHAVSYQMLYKPSI